MTEPFQKIRMNNEIMNLAWNPTQPTLIVVCMSDGTVKLLEVTENLKIMATLPAVVAARSGKFLPLYHFQPWWQLAVISFYKVSSSLD